MTVNKSNFSQNTKLPINKNNPSFGVSKRYLKNAIIGEARTLALHAGREFAHFNPDKSALARLALSKLWSDVFLTVGVAIEENGNFRRTMKILSTFHPTNIFGLIGISMLKAARATAKLIKI